MSWGGADFSGENYFDTYFTTPTGHAPVTFVAATGDVGSDSGTDWPADSPNVLGVGGTSLTASSSGMYSGEVGWSGSTGGISSVETEPSYQHSVQSTGHRTEPDVSYDADPYSGFPVYDSLASGDGDGWFVLGGTSAGSPQWAALIAIADQLRVNAGKTTLDGPTVTLPLLYSTYTNPTAYAADFHDVTSGSSGEYSATVGYDEVTGLGTPKANAIVQTLVNGIAPASAATLAVRPASGMVGLPSLLTLHKKVSAFESGPIAIENSTSSTLMLPPAQHVVVDSPLATSAVCTAPGPIIPLADNFENKPVICTFSPTIVIGNPALDVFPTSTADSEVEFADTTTSDTLLDTDHADARVSVLPAVENTWPAANADGNDMHSSSVLKAAAAIGLTALLVTVASSRCRAQTKYTAGQNSLADLEILSF
jgi:hypothetical protein